MWRSISVGSFGLTARTFYDYLRHGQRVLDPPRRLHRREGALVLIGAGIGVMLATVEHLNRRQHVKESDHLEKMSGAVASGAGH